MTAIDDITKLYVGYYDRAPDPEGLNYWVGRANVGMSLLEIAQSFSVQVESTSLYSFLASPQTSSAESFLNSVYQNLFNRPIDSEGLNYWTGELSNGKPVGRMIVDIISGAQGADKIIVDNKTMVGQFYAAELGASGSGGFRLADARQVLDGVNDTTASVTSAQTLALSLTREYLTLIVNDPTGMLAPFEADIRQSFHLAWDMWEVFFTRRAPIEIEISFEPNSGGFLALATSSFFPNGDNFNGQPVLQGAVGLELITGIDQNGAEPDGEVRIGDNPSQLVFRTSLSEPVPFAKFDAVSVFAHEIGHLLGFASGLQGGGLAIYDRFVSSGAFTGPNAVAANGGVPVPLTQGSESHLANTSDLMATALVNGQTRMVEPLHIAILQDMGLPVSVLGAGGLV
jgi:hypothetical protein